MQYQVVKIGGSDVGFELQRKEMTDGASVSV